jgi:hypothetical protein
MVRRVGIVGRQPLGDEGATAWVRTAFNSLLGERLETLVGVSALRSEAEQLFAEVVRARGGTVEVTPPAAGQPRPGSPCALQLAVRPGAPPPVPDETDDLIRHARDRGEPVVILDPLKREMTRLGAAPASSPAGALADIELDRARTIGDPLLDPIVSAYVAAHGQSAVGRLMGTLFRTHALPEDHPLVAAYLHTIGDLPIGEARAIEEGQRLFALLGPEIFLVLGSSALPLAFAAGNGVQAIFRARRLKDDPIRRLYDTAQMVINVMQVGELAVGRLGWRTARKVRLIHALVRAHVQSDPAAPWSDAWGTPINQEDLAGTLLTFSVAVLHGLRRMGARISDGEGDAYVQAWSAVGRLLGIDEALLSATEGDATRLAFRIGNRQVRETDEGRQLAEQLLGAVATLFPIPGYANSLTHYFLEDSVFGENVARILHLPKAGWTRALVAARAWQKRKVLALLAIVPGARRRRSYLARRFVQAMLLWKRPDQVAPFEVPPELARRWGLRSGATRAVTGQDLR